MSKTNDPLATRRLGNRPKAEAVREAKAVKGAHARSVLAQNQNDGDKTSMTIIPNRRIPNPPSTRGTEK
jgi:hypothetical protein